MRKTILVLLFLLIAPVIALGSSEWTATCTIYGGVVADNTTCTTVTVPRDVDALGVIFPTITSATMTLQGSYNGTTWYNVYYTAGAAAAPALYQIGAGTGAVALEIPKEAGAFNYLRFLAGAGQAANRTIRFVGRYK